LETLAKILALLALFAAAMGLMVWLLPKVLLHADKRIERVQRSTLASEDDERRYPR